MRLKSLREQWKKVPHVVCSNPFLCSCFQGQKKTVKKYLRNQEWISVHLSVKHQCQTPCPTMADDIEQIKICIFFFFWLKEAGSNSDRTKFNLVWKHISYASLNFDRCNRPDILTWDQHCLHFFLNILKFCNAVNNIHIMTYILNCN